MVQLNSLRSTMTFLFYEPGQAGAKVHSFSADRVGLPSEYLRKCPQAFSQNCPGPRLILIAWMGSATSINLGDFLHRCVGKLFDVFNGTYG